jgi:uncharacterized membrane protein
MGNWQEYCWRTDFEVAAGLSRWGGECGRREPSETRAATTRGVTALAKSLGVSNHSMNPFDLKAALLARHAQHPAIIHFPIAVFVTSVVFDCLAIWRKSRLMTAVAYYNLLAAAVTVPLAVVSGIGAWQWGLEGARLKGNLLLHLIFALSASGMIWTLCGWRIQHEMNRTQPPGKLYYAAAFLTLLLIILASHLGGILSGVEGGAM